jgi:hypothetical protein
VKDKQKTKRIGNDALFRPSVVVPSRPRPSRPVFFRPSVGRPAPVEPVDVDQTADAGRVAGLGLAVLDPVEDKTLTKDGRMRTLRSDIGDRIEDAVDVFPVEGFA